MTKIVPSYRLRGPYRRVGGHSWVARLPFEFEEDGDTAEAARSQWQLSENGVPLGPAHALHREIEGAGAGRFSHWGAQLYFSALDNSDPNTNGRFYSLRWAGSGAKPWLAQFDELFPANDAPFGSRQDVQACSGLFAVFGLSFSGSTLVNAILGSHPLVFGGGELANLMIGERAKCAVCGAQCAYWTPEARAPISRDNIYHQISRLFGRPFVADTSKARYWFDDVLPRFPSLPVSRVLLVKHPLRHVASFFEKKETAGRARDGSLVFGTWERALIRMRDFYEEYALPGKTRTKPKYSNQPWRTEVDFILRYEDFVASPRDALKIPLARIGLEYHPRMEAWMHMEHHHIGGNVGPMVQIGNHSPYLPVAQKKYRQRGVFLDDSYRDIFDPEIIEEISRHPDAQWMCEQFGY